MRRFLHTHWKLIAILLAIVLALTTVETDSAPATAALSARLRAHVEAIAPERHSSATPRELERQARYIEQALSGFGYALERQEYEAGGQKLRSIEASVANVARDRRPERIFIIGAHHDCAPGANHKGSGTAAVLELARLLKTVRPSHGTEIKFVFFVNEEPPRFMGEEPGSMRHPRELERQGRNAAGAAILATAGWPSNSPGNRRLPPGLEKQYPRTGNFIAFVGSLESSALVRQALAAFKERPDVPAHGLAAPAHVMGVTLSDHGAYERHGYPALMITDTAFLRYPYHHASRDTPDMADTGGMARVVEGLARTIQSLAGAASI